MLKPITSIPFLLFTPDSTEGAGSDEGTLATASAVIENDPFSEAADGIEDPQYPVLVPDRIIKMECRKAKIEKVKDKELENLVIQIKTVDDQPTTDGKTQKAGLVGTIRLGITPHTGYTNVEGTEVRAHTVEEIKAEMAQLARAFFGQETKTSARSIWTNPDMLIGQIAMFRIGIKKASGNFPESNTFKFVPVKKA